MTRALTLGLIVLLTTAGISPSLARSHRPRHHGYAHFHSARTHYGVRSYGFAPGYRGSFGGQCAPHYDSAGVADGCL